MNAVTISVLGRIICTLGCIVAAYLLKSHNQSGWGWFVFLALCLGLYDVSMTFR